MFPPCVHPGTLLRLVLVPFSRPDNLQMFHLRAPPSLRIIRRRTPGMVPQCWFQGVIVTL